jgi:uncharacterized protein with ParB-like and HNH nuclease domain
MEKEINEIISLAYKNRFSLYYKPDYCLVRVYFRNGSQHKEVGATVIEATTKMVDYLKNNKNLKCS